MKIHLDVEKYRESARKMYDLAESKRRRAYTMLDIMENLEKYETKGLLESINPAFQGRLEHEIYVICDRLESYGDFLNAVADEFEQNDEYILRS